LQEWHDKRKESRNSGVEKSERKSLLIKILVVSLPSALKIKQFFKIPDVVL
jgi:hypothetical protein